jgi:hypothetical protein
MTPGAAPRPLPGAAEAMVRQYEELRRRALDGSGWTSRLGLAVLVREGLAAWITTWATVPVPPSSTPDPSHGAALRLADDRHAEIVRLLAGLVQPWLDRRPVP